MADANAEDERGVYGTIREALITGSAVVVPFVVTLLVLSVVVDFFYRQITRFSDLLLLVPGVSGTVREVIIDVLVPVVLLLTILLLGLFVNRSRFVEQSVEYVDRAVGAIPGVGSIYDSFRQMSDVVMRSDVKNFRDVKVLEFPQEEVYTLGFLTTRTPPAIAATTRHEEMVTLFLPLAPNPVMGGNLVHVPEERVFDVDMTIEEAMQTVVTTGVALGRSDLDEGLSGEELEALTGVDVAARSATSRSGEDADGRQRE